MRPRLIALALVLACGDGGAPPSGARARRPIINGLADMGHWYVGMVRDVGNGVCTGTLVSSRTVITAGHCWGTGPGAIDRVQFDVGRPLTRITVPVARSLRHPGFDDVSLTNDLALVQLAADAPVQPAPLLRETLGAAHIGPSFAWVGYGDTDVFGNGSGTRRVATFPIQLVGPVANIPVPPSAPPGASDSIDVTQLYFRVTGRNTCTGDSGGPGFVVRNGVERHAGVTSYGDDACAYDGVAARTDAARLPWIQQTLDAFEPGAPCRADGFCGAGCVSTSPAPLGTLSDPDCADRHCGADGICVLSCSPVDSDCQSLAIDTCRADGLCRPGCAAPDPDCSGGSGGGSGGSSGGSSGGGAPAGGSGGASAGGSAFAGGSAVAGGAAGGESMEKSSGGGCRCSLAAPPWALALSGLIRRTSRRRR